MKIIVLVKQVPDTWGDRVLDERTGLLDRGASDAVIDEIGERATEVALRVKDADKATEVVALTMGPKGAVDVLRKALAMGADSAIHVLDDELAAADLVRTARVIAAAVQKAGFDLVIAGNESTDGRGGVLPAMLAELLQLPAATGLGEVDIDASGVRGTRVTDDGTVALHSGLPAIASITEGAAEARFPSFKGVMQAKKKPLETWSLGDLGVGQAAAHTEVRSTAQRPERQAGVKITDDGTAAAQLVEFLAANRLV
jgi:electron transfer flavoprotein beta subunit